MDLWTKNASEAHVGLNLSLKLHTEEQIGEVQKKKVLGQFG